MAGLRWFMARLYVPVGHWTVIFWTGDRNSVQGHMVPATCDIVQTQDTAAKLGAGKVTQSGYLGS